VTGSCFDFVVFADGKDKKVRFKEPHIKRELLLPELNLEKELKDNFDRIHQEAKGIFN
tara:strand:- start:210 stop:383 length:174 start_codon:yes stop_codon:yes gene_type:complete